MADPTRIPGPVAGRSDARPAREPTAQAGAADTQADEPRRTLRTLPYAGRRGPVALVRRLHLPVRPFLWLAILGPGLISANAGNDAGGIATYASAGASYGYSLLWVLLVITLSLAVVQEMCARMGVVTGKGLTELIREHFGIRWTLFATLALFVANAGTAFSEYIGIGAAMELLGVSRYIAVPVFAVFLWLTVVRFSYKAVERVFLLMTLPFFAYPISAFLAHPKWTQVAQNTFVPSFHMSAGYMTVVVALIGTTVTPYMQVYVQSALVEKGVSPVSYAAERLDVYGGAIFGNIVAFFIIVATGATLFVHGISVNSAADAARALEPFAGPAAQTLFAIGLLGASLLAGAVLPLTTAYSFTEAFGFEKGISVGFREAPVFMTIFTGLIVLCALAALIPGLPVIQVLLLIQVLNALLLPVVLIAALRITNDRELMGEYANGRVMNLIAVLTTVFVVALSSIYLVIALLQPFGI
jgi:Mn2+/Fe2+ NRAMP family transporter